MGRRKNTFSRALGQLKSTSIDEKLEVLQERPTNSTVGINDPVAGTLTRTDSIPSGTEADHSTIDWDVDGGDGKDTSGLFDENGDSKFIGPPGDNSYLLGPMAVMYYTWAYPWTMIGYIRESDRRMVNLGRIDGKLGDWDGSPGDSSSGSGTFWSYGQLTTEQALWFRDTQKKDNAGNAPENANYRAFYPGPPSNTPDAFGRYLCTITGTPKQNKDTYREVSPMDMQGSDNLSAMMDRLKNNPFNQKGVFSGKTPIEKIAGIFNFTWEQLDNAMNNATGVADAALPFIDFIKQQVGFRNYTEANPRQTTMSPIDAQQAADGMHEIVSQWNPQRLKDLGNGAPMTKAELDQINNHMNAGGGLGPMPTNPTPQKGGDSDSYRLIVNNIGNNKAFKGNVKVDKNGVPYVTGINDTYVFTGDTDASAPLAPELIKFMAQLPGVQEKIKNSKDGNIIIDYVKDYEIMDMKSKVTKDKGGTMKVKNMPIRVKLSVPSGVNTGYIDRQLHNIGVTNSYEPEGKVLSESRKSILKNLKKPVVIPETKQKSYKVRPGRRGKTNFQGMDKLIGNPIPQESFKKTERNAWSKDWQNYNTKLSQAKKNEVLELVGDGKVAFNYMLNDSKALNAEQMEKFWGLHPEMYSYFYNGKKYKAMRKEEINGDFLVFLVDENGVKSNILQSELNEKLAEEREREMLDEYNKLNPKKEPISYEKDPLMKKVAKRLKGEFDYPDKPARKGYPNEPPPKQVDGWHPDYGKKYKYDKLDPVSAAMMRNAPTGDQEIDANVEKAARKPKIKVKEDLSDWRTELDIDR